jgi:hypothetical protein|tara:strand:- start:94 stop:321 length:228 start_codon:yes stop_codon:yes gene_type:complete
MTELISFNLSDQALGAVMMALQDSLMNQSDIVPVLKNLNFIPTEEGLVVKNPPLVRVNPGTFEPEGESTTTGVTD